MTDGAGSCYGDEGGASCYELLCGTPNENEPVYNLLCFSVSKRVVKNVTMFILALVFYVLMLSVITSGNSHKAKAN